MEARRDRSVSYSQDIPVDDGDGVTARALRFAEDGYLCPLRVLTKEQEDHTRAGLEALLNRHGGRLPHLFRHKLHLMFDWADALVHNQAILDGVENILGPDILCWTSNVLVKNAGDPAFVSWHQDAFYWGLEPNEVVTVWVALTPSTPESGCVQVIPGTHRAPVLPHVDTFDADNMLTRGQQIATGIKLEDAVDLVLAPGEASMHHIDLVHGSGPNESQMPRMGIAIRYMSAAVKKRGLPESALCVRGSAEASTFIPEVRPLHNFGARERMRHNRAIRKQVQNNYVANPGAPWLQTQRLKLKRRLSLVGLDLFYLGLGTRALFKK